MTEQVALLLADVYGMSDQESAGHLQTSPGGFVRLLVRARNRMHRCAGGRCALVGSSPADAPSGTPDEADPEAPFAKDSEGAPAQPIGGEFDEDKLRTLRRELLNGLGL